MEAKRLLRSRVIAARAGRSGEEIAAAGAALADHGAAACAALQHVAAYAAVGQEPPTRPLLDRLLATGTSVVLPVIRGTELRWAPYDGWDRLTQGPFGLWQPVAAERDVDVLAVVDLVLLPALAVDRHGNRLGRGKGYYDRALAALEPERAVAVVYDDEILDVVPTEPHDRRVGAALTPSGLHRLGR